MSECAQAVIFNFHIPKTAGTSLRAQMVASLGAEKIAFRRPNGELALMSDLNFNTVNLDRYRTIARALHMLPTFSKVVDRVNRKNPPETFEVARIQEMGALLATGHFRHTDIPLEVAENAVFAVVVREPLSRMWSHFRHWQEAQGTMWWHTGSIPYADTVRFEEFAADPQLANYHLDHMGDLDFSIFGSADNLEDFMLKIGIAPPDRGTLRLNQGRHNGIPKLSDQFMSEFEELHAADILLYERVNAVSTT